jgi:FkbM family methyltransferase
MVELPGGVVVEIDNPRHQQRCWLRGRYYEEALLEHVRKHYRGGVFIDGGACIGNHTLFFAALCDAHVIAVEPVARNMARLLRNAELSGLTERVTPVQAALGREPGRGAMQRMGKASGLYNLVEGDAVEVTTLDAIAPEERVTLIKLDVQWTEIPALQGGLALLERDHPALFIELMTRGEIADADALLGGLGYRRGPRFCASPTFEYKAAI